MSARRLPGTILALTPGDLVPGAGARLLAAASAAIGAGLRSILLREPGLSDRETLELARALRALLGPAGWLGLHDRVHLAPSAGADAVHVGHVSLRPREARAICAGATAIGYSAHAHDAADEHAGADYLFFGPVHDTPSKRGRLAPTGLDGLARAVRDARAPVWALGGIGPGEAAGVLAAGARGLVARGALLAAADPGAAYGALARAVAAAAPGRS